MKDVLIVTLVFVGLTIIIGALATRHDLDDCVPRSLAAMISGKPHVCLSRGDEDTCYPARLCEP